MAIPKMFGTASNACALYKPEAAPDRDTVLEKIFGPTAAPLKFTTVFTDSELLGICRRAFETIIPPWLWAVRFVNDPACPWSIPANCLEILDVLVILPRADSTVSAINPCVGL